MVLTDWLIEPIRRILPPVGMIDFSPLVAWLLLSLVRGCRAVAALIEPDVSRASALRVRAPPRRAAGSARDLASPGWLRPLARSRQR